MSLWKSWQEINIKIPESIFLKKICDNFKAFIYLGFILIIIWCIQTGRNFLFPTGNFLVDFVCLANIISMITITISNTIEVIAEQYFKIRRKIDELKIVNELIRS